LSTALPERKDVPIEHTWDTASVFESDAAWEKAVEEATAKLPELARFKGRLGEGPAVLADWFDLVDELYGLIGKIEHLRHAALYRGHVGPGRPRPSTTAAGR